MSYSFHIRAASKAEATAKVTDQMAVMVKAQPFHAVDEAPALAAATSLIGLLPEDASQDVVVSMSGGGYSVSNAIRHLSVSVSVSLADKEKAAS